MWEQDGKMYHIRCKKGDVGRYVLLPGDPFRTDLIASYLDNAEMTAHNREHRTWTGTLLGEKVSVTSTGMGCPSTAIALEELIACGADTFIRVGTAGCINQAKRNKETIGGIVTAAVRDEGTTRQYVPVEYPAVADRRVVEALAQAAKKLGYCFEEGITYTKDSLYTHIFPEMVPLAEMYMDRQKVWERANVLLTEMEASAVLVISSIRGCRASGIMAFSDLDDAAGAVDKEIRTACEAVKILIEQDKAQ
ncbi:uridine phosphorylase [Clostridium sp. MCC353]|uniref:nucleoside phosphorylase n=1 Tax=Clostridium sp. MCC353 TaxID=2592646 RepID=UPI001C00A3E9|nr:nucleoside phosphorylase [Clostridium sp. MCC353]MBT9776749.1 uridine phosphorylase [Clostridium sp. MCC353]